MATSGRFFSEILISLLITLVAGCGVRSQFKIERLSFLDTVHSVYMVIDTNQLNPIAQKNLFYVVNSSKNDSVVDNNVKNFLDSSRFVGEALRSFPTVEILFYRKSANVEALVLKKDRRLLPLCSNDIIWEFVYDEGQVRSAFKFKDGEIVDP